MIIDARTYLAGMALQGLLADPTPCSAESDEYSFEETAAHYADLAVGYADATIKKLSE